MSYRLAVNNDITTFMADTNESASMYRSCDERQISALYPLIIDKIRHAQANQEPDVQWDLGVFSPIMLNDGTNDIPGYVQNVHPDTGKVDIVLKNGEVKKDVDMNAISSLPAAVADPNTKANDYDITDMYFASGNYIKVPIRGVTTKPELEQQMNPILYVKRVTADASQMDFVMLDGILQVNLLNTPFSMSNFVKDSFQVDNINWFHDSSKGYNANSRSFYMPVQARVNTDDLPDTYIGTKENVMAKNYIMQIIDNVYQRAHDKQSTKDGTVEQYRDDGMGIGRYVVPFVYSIFAMHPDMTVAQYLDEVRQVYKEINPEDNRDPFSSIELLNIANQKLRNKYFPSALSRPDTVQNIINDVRQLAMQYRAEIAQHGDQDKEDLPEPAFDEIINKYRDNYNATYMNLPQFVEDVFDLMYVYNQSDDDILKLAGSRGFNNLGSIAGIINQTANKRNMQYAIRQMMLAVNDAYQYNRAHDNNSTDDLINLTKSVLIQKTPAGKYRYIQELVNGENDEIFKSIFNALRAGVTFDRIESALLYSNSIDTTVINKLIQVNPNDIDRAVDALVPGQGITSTQSQIEQSPVYSVLYNAINQYAQVKNTIGANAAIKTLKDSLYKASGLIFYDDTIKKIADLYDGVNDVKQFIDILIGKALSQNNNDVTILNGAIADTIWDKILPANGIM